MNAYAAAYDPYAAYRNYIAAPVAPVGPAAITPYAPYPTYSAPYAPIVAFGQEPAAPRPGALDQARTFLSTPSVGGLSRGALLAIGLAGATVVYGASTNWFGLAKGGRMRSARR